MLVVERGAVGRGIRTLEQHVSLISPTDNKITFWPTAVCVCARVFLCVREQERIHPQDDGFETFDWQRLPDHLSCSLH